MAETTWNRHHVLSLADFSADELNIVLQTANSFKDVLYRKTKKVPTLQARLVTNLFFEPSTRTRSSFELAAKRLSADVLNFSPGTSSLSKGETILDTAKTFLAMGADMMVIRHQHSGVPQMIAQAMDDLGEQVGVLNAGDGFHEHPSQGLLDLFTLCTTLDPDQPTTHLLTGKKIAIVGDILHSRVARSNLSSLVTCGADVHLAGPPTLLPKEFADYGAQVHWSLEPALEQADFVMTLRLQHERMSQHLIPSIREYHQQFGITRDRIQRCQPQVKVLHPGPVNRGVEISSDLMDDESLSLIPHQVTSGIAVRMALLYLISNRSR
ncbi:aspartate carbamoyltransferase catalytic subunit [Acaryochloris marina]|uniref:Aspartate carbamoyltransferase catalytic subunit n=1 Tax=Acaryochloris marina (strain MBIC 11017) TaxID=329726 RepID=PYRB_ACAM1|nr:aspartate carbamoyltransferase catalytic subunit [Acaryochloris marina]B0CED7.1 RecName: Full=Aspartate carbamoyltransferase catalytic subunit; AltName: Full=Aspartate transcarbamylase; Short=ATCase [Acaryochloris marina MBIC11017]ABW26903.1 aspartate carbamoyltransferase [Acaryochloris marina MBIC11017]BDM81674.1 aspartate carbamoyltransferase [Acaryochloris marina MBIC10699]